MVTTIAKRRAKVQSKCHHQQTNTQLFCRPDALPVAQPTVSEHWREKTIHRTDKLNILVQFWRGHYRYGHWSVLKALTAFVQCSRRAVISSTPC